MSDGGSVKEYEYSYDAMVEQADYRAPEALFGLMYEYVSAGECLLDLGVGTGRVAGLFARAGLHVSGMDRSPVMLGLCALKQNFQTLKQHDLLKAPYPYGSESYDFITCVGVLNHFEDLAVVFGECARILRKGGYFGFMAGHGNSSAADKMQEQEGRDDCGMNSQSEEDIRQYLAANSMQLQRSLVMEVKSGMCHERVMPVRLYVVRKKSAE